MRPPRRLATMPMRPRPRAFARSLSANGEAEAAAGRLVLVRDEAKTTEQLIAELEADPRVVFAEPNAVVETGDADKEAPQGRACGRSAHQGVGDRG